MRIVLLCEGLSEEALKRPMRRFLTARCQALGCSQVGIDFKRFNGAPNCDQLMRYLDYYGRDPDVIAVVGLIDVYPGFTDAAAAKRFLSKCVSPSSFLSKFRAHAAQMELEAWLLPFWTEIAARLGVSSQPPGKEPEKVDGQKPPSEHLKELYRRAKVRKRYNKADEAARLFGRYNIEKAADHCPELRALLETLESLCQLQKPTE